MNKLNQPLVSIIIPTYNRASFLGETISSVQKQTYNNWECIIVDDGSTDYTEELMEFFLDRDKRVKFFKRPESWSKGGNSCRNYGFKISKGEYIQWLDSDDIISIDKLEKQVVNMRSNNADVGTCKWGRFYQMSDAWVSNDFSVYKDFESSLLFFGALAQSKGFFPIHAYLLKREIIEKAGGWLSFLNINQDGEFMARIIINARKICFSNDGIAFYRFSKKEGISAYTDSQKVQNLINSWRLIEAYMIINYEQENFEFIKTAKMNIYKANLDRKELLNKNQDFFKGVEEGRFRKVVKKLFT